MDLQEFKTDLIEAADIYKADSRLLWALAFDMEVAGSYLTLAQNMLDTAESEKDALETVGALRDSIDKTLRLLEQEVRLLTLQGALERRQFNAKREA